MRFLLVLTLALPMSVSAQDVHFSGDATLACLTRTEDHAARLMCAGLSAGNCINAPGGQTTVGMVDCFDREWRLWDLMLNQNYQARMAEAKVRDKEAVGYGQSVAKEAETLRNMQRSWISYRDAACTYERSLWGGGTGGGPATVACMMELTAAQAIRLETRFGP
ncbi:DUF1311 domain-containing protein [Roseobacter sp. YSTF-M11]|uniref:DUF1311 domain-containing protein n=1 Tax=Roseobacter insulae TaxID=2859783 RepID=A0A9X1FUN6_9RHOB|nr:lysozyme inhibitor LprI family protein [Roseobacter insulae]MBW4707891.1 DUF1311 domain-containing protein [Roseobacter insulae]